MAKISAISAPTAEQDLSLPEVQLEFHHGKLRPTVYPVTDVSFLVGSVPGCDLRVPGANLPPLLCLILRRPGGVALRKLSPTHPMLLNGEPAANGPLQEGDCLRIGNTELVFHIQASASDSLVGNVAAADAVFPQPLEAARQQLQQQIQAFRQQVVQFTEERKNQELETRKQQEQLEKEKTRWQQRQDELQHECRELKAQIEKAQADAKQHEEKLEVPAELLEREQALAAGEQQIKQRQADLDQQLEELAVTRQELADIRKQLYERYQERRDRLAGLQEAVNHAARKVQERKKQVDAEILQLTIRQQEVAGRQAEMDNHAAEMDRREMQLDDRQRLLEERQQTLQQELADQLAEGQMLEQKLVADRKSLEEAQAQHQADLVRLDRFQGSLDQREQEIQARSAELDSRQEQLQAGQKKMEEQVIHLNEWHTRLCAMAEQIARQKEEQESQAADLAHRTASLEGQQTMLANLRHRLEQMKEEVRAGEQQLVEDRTRQQGSEEELKRQQLELQQLQAQLNSEKTALEQDRRQLAERSSVMETAVNQLRQTQEKMAEAEKQLQQDRQEAETLAEQQKERAATLESKEAELHESQQRLEADRQALMERMQMLSQAEQARESLQEQLRRRSEELSARQKSLEEQASQLQTELEQMQQQRADFEREQQEVTERAGAHMREVEAKSRDLLQQTEALNRRETALQENLEKLREQGRFMAEQRKQFQVEEEQLRQLRQETEQATAQARADFEAARREAVELQHRLPDLELRAGTAFERLSYARDQLREYINEVHSYANQCQEHLEGARADIRAEGERLQAREQALRRQQDEQRLTLAGFRQQIIAWQGQIAEFKRLLAENENRLELRRAEVTQKAKLVDEETLRLAKQAEDLEEQQREVASQRDEMTYHLNDMRDWYRKKLRELAGLDPDEVDAELALAETGRSGEEAAVPGRDILSLTGDIEPADRRLGELLQSLGLIDADTLSALLVEARRQRRSLRQILIAGGTVTLYQMSLIETGELDSLMLGTVRVVDRLQVTPHETVYQVFDPRRGRNALLRHLAEEVMADAVHPDEFRQRFSQAMISHPNLMATWEVQDIAGRPAVWQEWLTGLPGTDWPDLAAVPGVWFRLFSQAALALHTAHENGLVHGHLRPSDFFFTVEGVLKLCNHGEPPWLANPPVDNSWDDPAGDLQALGQIASAWPKPRKGRKTKPLPPVLTDLLQRLQPPAGDQRIDSAAVLLQELDALSDQVPANPEAWNRFLQYVREHASGGGILKQSA